jgi:hypothetical protein
MDSSIPVLITQAEPVDLVRSTLGQLNRVILGKEHQLRLCIACLLARGHLLIEDVPGVGKTTLAHALAETLGLSYQRIQFTSDLLPADIIGVSIFDRETSSFHFHKGPIFSQLVLADEVNRATPKAQSALLEAMEEHQVTVDGQTYPLAAPFFVIATQNPMYQIGTFPLPESQLDRFLMRIELGYPDPTLERQLLMGRRFTRPMRCSTTFRPSCDIHAKRPITSRDCRRGRPSPCSGRRRHGLSFMDTPAYCPKTFRRCCPRWSVIDSNHARMLRHARRRTSARAC